MGEARSISARGVAPWPQADVWRPHALLDPLATHLALFCVAASFVIPFSGLGVDLCPLHAFTGLPCPGCGMTRAFIALAAGELAVAVGANPFVVVAYPTFVALGALALLPPSMRSRGEAWISRRSGAIGRIYMLMVFAFVGFGLARFGWFLALGERFP